MEQPRSCPVVQVVGKEDVVIHAPKEEGCEGDDEDELSGRQEHSGQSPGQPWGVLPTLRSPPGLLGFGGSGCAGWTRSRHY